MLQAQLCQTRLGLLAPDSANGRQFAINRHSRFPIARFLEQLRGVETGFIKPEKFMLHIGAGAALQDIVVGR